MSVTVGQLLELLDQLAPLEGAEEWDNVGLLVGRRNAPVECVLCALDLTEDVLDEAVEKGAQMIVTHHPILFRGRKNLCEDDPEGRLLCRLVRSGVALVAMHTNFDNAHPGVNDVLARSLGLEDVEPVEHGMCVGTVGETTLAAFRKQVEKALGGPVRMYGRGSTPVKRVAVMGGSGGDYAAFARLAGADVFVTGEVGYHKGLSAVDEGLCVLEAGHAATENPAISLLAGGLQTAANVVQYNVHVLRSERELFL